MTIASICKCGKLARKYKSISHNSYLFECGACKAVFVTSRIISLNKQPKQIPEIKIGDRAFCINNRNKLFMSVGTVLAVDHMHIRMQFGSIKIWMHQSNLSLIQEEYDSK